MEQPAYAVDGDLMRRRNGSQAVECFRGGCRHIKAGHLMCPYTCHEVDLGVLVKCNRMLGHK